MTVHSDMPAPPEMPPEVYANEAASRFFSQYLDFEDYFRNDDREDLLLFYEVIRRCPEARALWRRLRERERITVELFKRLGIERPSIYERWMTAKARFDRDYPVDCSSPKEP
jgi:hypothetical protein